MKRFLLMACAGLFALSLSLQDAEAKRLGGGAAKGMQRESLTQKQAAPQPSQQTAAAQAANPVPAAAPRSNWMGPLAGLAAGLGIAALLSHFGLGEGLADLLMVLFLLATVIFAFRMLFRTRPLESDPLGESMQYAGIGGLSMGTPGDAIAPSSASTSSAPTSVTAVSRAIPANFYQEGFLRVAKLNFIRLEAANDGGNLDDIREEKDAAAQPFDEVWNLVKPADGSRGWVLAGIQPLLY